MFGDLKKGQFTLSGDKPAQFMERDEIGMPPLTPDQEGTIDIVGDAIRAYRDATKDLLDKKYSHLKDVAPEYLVDPGNIFVTSCVGGVVIRYERKVESSKILSGWVSQELPQVAAMLSQNLIQCHATSQFSSSVEKTGMELTLSSSNPGAGHSTTLFSLRIGFDVVLERPDTIPVPGQKPFCLSSVRNAFELQMLGELVGEQPGSGQHFVSRTRLRLPVGWECIEIYPDTVLEQWKPEYASTWAERDILAAVVAGQLRESHFQSLDPSAAARGEYAVLLTEFKSLLDSEPDNEELVQVFLRDHPELLCPTQTKMWPKLGLGEKKTDFVFRDATLDYLLVELEKSTHALFRKDGHPRDELNVARGQIVDWKRYIEDNLRTVQDELGLSGISTNPRSLIVIGRSNALSPDNRRKLKAMENDQPKLRIMTYDDVYANAKAVIENLLGPIVFSGGATHIYHLKSK